MRRYEMMLIVTDTIEEDAAQAVVERAKKALADQGGTVLDEAWWGKRALAYEIDKRDHGFYAVLDVRGDLRGRGRGRAPAQDPRRGRPLQDRPPGCPHPREPLRRTTGPAHRPGA
jgi:ribosomal protein S6